MQRTRRQSQDLLQPYIAAKMSSLPAVFTLGDDNKYNGYANKALSGQQQYLCFVLAELADSESVGVSDTVSSLSFSASLILMKMTVGTF